MSTPAAGACAPSSANQTGISTLARAAYWLAPPLLCFAVYRHGLTAWFQADDFAWLALRLHVHDAQSLLHALFAPMAQGTIRPWSERAFFLAFEWLFGVNALPFRIWVFLTECVDLALLAAVTRRITGSPEAGLCAAILWLVNAGLALAMVWTSLYNQVLCGFFLLGAFWFLLRYIETGRRRDYLWQWALFLLGFGALEINVVYPALAALYTFLCARKYFRSTLPLFVPSALFAALHWMFVPARNAGVYALHFDAAIPATLLAYCFRALVPSQVDEIKGGPDVLLACLLAAALVAFTVLRMRQKDWLPVFFLGWFAIVLAPVLPLRDHVSFYYLALPTIGLAMLGGHALSISRHGPPIWKTVALVLTAAFVVMMVRADRIEISWWRERSRAVRRMVLGVARAHQLHPTQAILLDGVDTNLFWAGVFHHAFGIFGVSRVYLTPGSAARIQPLPEARVPDFELPGGPTIHGLNNNQIVVYQMGHAVLKAFTSSYENTVAEQLSSAPPRSVDVGNPVMAYLLGPEWYPLEESGFRWMPQHATLRIGGPGSASERLYLTGSCPAPALIRVSVDGQALPEILLRNCNTQFHVSLTLPNQAVGKKSLEIAIDSSRTFRAGNDGRELGLAFGFVEVR